MPCSRRPLAREAVLRRVDRGRAAGHRGVRRRSVSDCWIEDCSIAATIAQLTATDLGLGSCWIQIRGRQHADGRPAEEYVREVLGLPASLSVLCLLSVGYPAEDKPPRATGSLPWDKVEVRGPAADWAPASSSRRYLGAQGM